MGPNPLPPCTCLNPAFTSGNLFGVYQTPGNHYQCTGGTAVGQVIDSDGTPVNLESLITFCSSPSYIESCRCGDKETIGFPLIPLDVGLANLYFACQSGLGYGAYNIEFFCPYVFPSPSGSFPQPPLPSAPVSLCVLRLM